MPLNPSTGFANQLVGDARAGVWRDLPMPGINALYSWNYFNDFFSEADFTLVAGSVVDWTATDVGTVSADPSTFIVDDTANGILRLVADATDGDGNSVQFTGANGAGEFWSPAASRLLAFEARVAHSDWDAQHWFIGMAETAAPSLDGSGDLQADHYVGFHHNADDDADGIPRLVAAGTNGTDITETPGTTPSAGVDDAYRRFGFRVYGLDSIEWFIDGVSIHKATLASAWGTTENLCITFDSIMQAAVADTMDIDWVAVAGTR